MDTDAFDNLFDDGLELDFDLDDFDFEIDEAGEPQGQSCLQKNGIKHSDFHDERPEQA